MSRQFSFYFIWMRRFLCFPVLSLMLTTVIPVFSQVNAATKWVGTWGCAPYAADNNTPPSPYLENNTLRQIVRVSIGGDTLRVKFSNITCSTPVTLNSVNIAVSTEVGGSAIDLSTMKQLLFKGNGSVTMDAYSEVTSDPIAFPLTPGLHLAITIYYGQCRTGADMTFHYGSRTDSYILAGDQTGSESFAGATRVERWYTLNSIDVLAPDTSATAVAFGNSITDGYGLHGGRKNTWPDMFSGKLLDNPSTAHVGVLNMGIGATLVTSSIARFQPDVLNQAGVRWVIVFYGVNDIGGGVSADQIINAFENLIYQAHSENIRIYGATITPFKGSGYYSAAHEAIRAELNEWIRTPGNFDRYIDFDEVIRDPSDPERLLAAYSNDWLHPNAAGYRLLGESIDLNLFMGGDTTFEQPDFETHYYEAECATVGENWDILTDPQASNENYVTVKSGIQSANQAPSGSENHVLIPFSVDSAGDYSVFARLNCPDYDDDSFWVKMDDGTFTMYNGLVTSGWEWKSFGEYVLTEGEHTLTVGYREDGARLDKICISNSIYAPIGMGEEAENLCEISSVIHSLEGPDHYVLEQNYPNPFNPKTHIEFSIMEPANIILKIYDILGHEVTTLVNEHLDTGVHQVSWDAKNSNGKQVVSGTYFYRLAAGDRVISQKMLLLK